MCCPTQAQVFTDHGFINGRLLCKQLWLVWNGFSLQRAPVISVGRAEFGTVFLGWIVFGITSESVWRWNYRSIPLTSSGPSISLRPISLLVFWWILLGTCLSLYGIYQTLAPAGWPRALDTQYQDFIKSFGETAESDRIARGVLHALREKRAFSTFGAPNIFGGFLIPVLMALLGTIISPPAKRLRGLLYDRRFDRLLRALSKPVSRRDSSGFLYNRLVHFSFKSSDFGSIAKSFCICFYANVITNNANSILR